MAAREGEDLRVLLGVPSLEAILARPVVGSAAGPGPVGPGHVEAETGEAGLHKPAKRPLKATATPVQVRGRARRRPKAVLGLRTGPDTVVVVLLAGPTFRLALRRRAGLGRPRPALHRRLRPLRVASPVGHQGSVSAITGRPKNHGVLTHEAGVGAVVHAAMEPSPVANRFVVADTGLAAVGEGPTVPLAHDLAVATPPVADAVGAVMAALTGRGQEAADLLQAVPWPTLPAAGLDAPGLPMDLATARVRRAASVAGPVALLGPRGRATRKTTRVVPARPYRDREAARPGLTHRAP